MMRELPVQRSPRYPTIFCRSLHRWNGIPERVIFRAGELVYA